MSNPGPAVTNNPHPSNLSTNQAIRLLTVAKGVNLNAVGDTVLPILNATTYSVSNAILTNVSVNLTTAEIGIFTGPTASGTTIRANATSAANSASTVVAQLATVVTTAVTSQNLYLYTSVAQGAAATGDLYIYGYDLSS